VLSVDDILRFWDLGLSIIAARPTRYHGTRSPFDRRYSYLPLSRLVRSRRHGRRQLSLGGIQVPLPLRDKRWLSRSALPLFLDARYAKLTRLNFA
jgi:hypothetical protein